MKVVTLSGWKRSGKDLVADYLVDKHGFVKLSFAATLKDMVSEMYDISRTDIDSNEKKEAPILKYPVDPKDGFSRLVVDFMKKELPYHGDTQYWTPRALCILLGSVNRAVNNGYWVNTVVNQIAFGEHGLDKNFVITDARYRSELEQLERFFQKGLIKVKINRFDNSPSEDPSERDLENYKEFHHIINNSQNAGVSKDILFLQVERILNEHGL